MNKKERIKELVEQLNKASKAYYQDAVEIMPNVEYDALYDELLSLEEETGIILSNSPSQNVGYEILSELPKEEHPSRMLSLDKTKEREELKSWLKDKEGLLSWKLDGLTIVLTYEDGALIKALTRGNGVIGEVVTPQAKVFANVPHKIPFKGKLVLRGEAIITYSDFDKINEEIPELDAKYKNPRNLCSGSVRQLNTEITASRNVRFIAFSMVSAQDKDFKTRLEQMEFLAEQGFDTVENHLVNSDTILERIEAYAKAVEENDFPSDGLVLVYNDIAYGKSLGTTAKFPKDAIAFKWRDELKETKLLEIEWSPSRTGLINPVAIFEPVELEGTTVSRASVHNLSIMKELELGIGDVISVYKANMIIPQIEENFTRSGNIEIPKLCPVCGADTYIRNENGTETLVCENPACPVKQLKAFSLFVSRDALNIDGLSEASLERLIGKGFIAEPADLFHLDRFKDEIIAMEGFGKKSYENLISACERACDTECYRLLYGLGIPNFGIANAKIIAKYCENKWEKIASLDEEELCQIDQIGKVMAKAYVEFFADENNQLVIEHLLDVLRLDESFETKEGYFEGLTFVITGSLEHFSNRNELKDMLEDAGAKVASSVSAKTSYLINNDLQSNSSKNKKAKELGVQIIDEETILDWIKAGKVQ